MNNVKPSTSILLLLVGLVILILGGLVIELPFSMNYLQAQSFWRSSITIGIITSLTMATTVLRWKRSQLKDAVTRLQVFFSILITISILTPLLLSWANRIAVGQENVQQTEVILESEQARYTSRFGNSRLQKTQANQYLLFFYRDGQLYRVQDDEPFYPEAKTGDTLSLFIAKGRLGYEWVIRESKK